ncbi:MAG: N-acetylneuraminate synthase family protein [Anaerolineae bacterium]|nr:N-acetylneuraminate synthase family protein [Anaerolineae bacterium]
MNNTPAPTPVAIIAEVGSVHDGSFGNALHLIDTAAECGVDVVKFQTHISDAETLPDAPMPPYFKGEPRYEYFERTAFSFKQLQELKARCESQGVDFLSSPFSIEAVELLEELDVIHYKIPSGEVTNLPLLEAVGETGKHVYLSSGMSSWAEIDAAVETLLRYHDRVTVMQCTSAYPCPYEQVGLNVMLDMRERYGLPVGLSDHTLTNYAAFAAVTLGASVIEKHFTFSRHMYGSDARHSLEPPELADLVAGIRAIETTLASPVEKDDIEPYAGMKAIFEKSIVSVIDIPAGVIITRSMIGFKKPGTGIPARDHAKVIGRRAAHQIPKDTLIKESYLEG